MLVKHFVLIISVLIACANANVFPKSNLIEFGSESENAIQPGISQNTLNKNFWDNIYQNSILNTKTKYNTLSGEKVCFTCPIDRDTFQSLFHQAEQSTKSPGEVPKRITIAWTTQLSGNRMIFFCRNNTRMSQSPIYLGSDNPDGTNDGGELDYSCENDRLCLTNLKHNYPENYQCLVKSYVLPVKLNVIVQLQYVILYFAGDSVKFAYEKEVQVYENHMFTVKCEVPETNPVSNVNAYIDGKELKLTRLEKKTIDNRMSINTYSFEINATRDMNGKSVKCEASMKDIPTELASSIDLRSYISKDYMISVYYLPSCVYPTRTYRTGINRSIIIECPVNSSNPDVNTYKMIPPSSRTRYQLIDNNLETLPKMGRFRINPLSRHDFGLYECIPRSLAGTTKCDINIELGATPDPPKDCSVHFNSMNNKTYAQFTCKPGFNQGGLTSFLTIYEIDLVDKTLKLSGRVNIDDGNLNQEIPFITPTNEFEYYEFLVMQENNYGNSTSVKLTLGVNNQAKASHWMEDKKMVIVGAGAGLLVFVVFICCCCCLTDMFTQSKSDNPCCKCCSPSDQNEDDGSTYKKAPLDGDASGTLINQPFQGFNTNPKMTGTLMNNASSYEYYDNTSTGLLTETYSKNYLNKSNSRLLKKSPSYDDGNDEDNYSNEDDEEEHEHYMNSSNRKLKNYGDSSEESSSGSSSDRKSYIDNQQNYLSLKSNGHKKIPYSNNNDANYSRDQNNSHANQYITNNYSTIDSKKFIKTENGLVYTPLNGGILKKSTDALMIEEEEHLDSKYRLEESTYEDLRNQRNLNNKISNTYSNVKKSTHLPMTNKAIFGVPPLQQDNFKNELNLKLKSFNNDGRNSGKIPNQAEINKNGQQYNIEQLSTATTSLSSASSCASNSELTKEATQNKKAPLAPELTESLMSASGTLPSNTNNNSNTNSSNNTYSLLKTTLNVKGASEALESSLAMHQFNASNNLRKSQNKINANPTTKPPILKPKPRTTSNTPHAKPQPNKSNSSGIDNSVHNQSGDALISNFKETSLHTSPSTSVTDVSSNNLTPQHNNTNFIDDITSAQINNLVKSSNGFQRNLNNYQQPLRQQSSNPNGIHKATTTFTTNPNTDGVIYSTTKINGNANGDLTVRTYESTTLNRKTKNNNPSIDEEISAAKKSNPNLLNQSRTLERRKIQNSEC